MGSERMRTGEMRSKAKTSSPQNPQRWGHKFPQYLSPHSKNFKSTNFVVDLDQRI